MIFPLQLYSFGVTNPSHANMYLCLCGVVRVLIGLLRMREWNENSHHAAVAW